MAEILLRLVSNRTPSKWKVGRAGGGVMVSTLGTVSTAVRSVRAQLGLGGKARKNSGSKRMKMGMWSDRVEGKWSDHSEK